jgi:uncharacterized membrane protein YuzA (DUF378 family)
MSATVTGLIPILAGILAMLGAALNWRIVAGSGKLLNRLLGDTAARVIYFLIGLGVFMLGVGQLIGANWF